MKPIIKIALIIIIVLLFVGIVNYCRNSIIINKVLKLQSENVVTSTQSVILQTNLNGETSSDQQLAKDITIPNTISFSDKLFYIIRSKDNCYCIKINDIYVYINKDTGYRVKDEIPRMNAYTNYTYIDSEL